MPHYRPPRRFIPARAGNAYGLSVVRRLDAVHPRAGGERLAASRSCSSPSGSSPRGRGTHSGAVPDGDRIRFIPARAGNAGSVPPPRPSCTVHPRAGGERYRMTVVMHPHSGSSPRGRGTHTSRVSGSRSLRFIPARAGNAPSASSSRSRGPVHPRAGGERLSDQSMSDLFFGSSPRGRGTLELGDDVPVLRRFIPARAGNAVPAAQSPGLWPVHPRAGGERPDTNYDTAQDNGSSPRGRGTPPVRPRRCRRDGFIPARAGNARSFRSAPFRYRGSSPRGRGTLRPRVRGRIQHRFIPARAGNAHPGRRVGPVSPVHPRAGGERSAASIRVSCPSGSSPRGRGTPRPGSSDAIRKRFIPARAGNARAPERGPPRVFGSSPRGRGTREGDALQAGRGRFIPARAGNATSTWRKPCCTSVHPRAGGERSQRARL